MIEIIMRFLLEHLQEFAKSTWHPSIFWQNRKNYAPTV
jgi:hypothetical protein